MSAARSLPRRRGTTTAALAGAAGAVVVLLLLPTLFPSSAVYGFLLAPPPPPSVVVHPLRRAPTTSSSTTTTTTFFPSCPSRPHAIAASSSSAPDEDNDGGIVPSPSPADDDDDDGTTTTTTTMMDVSTDPRLRRVRLSRATGIDWGTDLSFSFVYVRGMEPSGSAYLSGLVEKGDQVCELRPVVMMMSSSGRRDIDDDVNNVAIDLVGASFDAVMGSFASLGRDVREVDIVFFRGTKDELKEACTGGGDKSSKVGGEGETITITVVQNDGSKGGGGSIASRIIKAKAGCNVRKVLTDNGINVYQSVTRWTNCKGKQLCGTCIVNVSDGGGSTNRKSLDEASTLRENPDSYRLSCVTFAYGDVTVETFPPVKAAQWTR